MSPRKSILAAATVAALAVLAPDDAAAFERQWRAGGGVGLAGLTEFQGAFSSPAAGLHLAYGVSDMFDVMLELNSSSHSIVADSRSTVYSASAGLAYKLDVIEWVPYFAVLVGYYRFAGPSPFESPNQAGAGLALGIDYAFERSFAVGAQIRYHGFMDDLPASVLGTGEGPYFTSLLRFEYRWGF